MSLQNLLSLHWLPPMPTSFSHLEMVLLMPLIVPIWLVWERMQPRVQFLGIRLQQRLPTNRALKHLSALSISICFAMLVLIWMGPTHAVPVTKEIREHIALSVVIDTSGSMGEPITDPELVAFATAESKRAGADKIRKIDAAKAGPRVFIENRTEPTPGGTARRSKDLIGLFTFGDSFYRVCVLTDDTDLLLDELDNLGKVTKEGTNFEGPTSSTANVGCFQGMIDHFVEMKKVFKRKGAEFPTTLSATFVTDGESSISEERFKELRAQISKLGMYVNILGVGDSWTKKAEPGKTDSTSDIRRLVDAINEDAKKVEAERRLAAGLPGMTSEEEANPLLLHARIFPVADAKQMREAFQFLDTLHRTPVTYEHTNGWHEETRLFSRIALAAFILSIAFAARVGRRI